MKPLLVKQQPGSGRLLQGKTSSLVLPDLRLTPVLDEVLGKQPLRSLGPLKPAAGKKRTELVP